MHGKLDDVRIAVIGLGYVGLPLAFEFSSQFPVLGFDINLTRISELQNGTDRTGEVDLKSEGMRRLTFSSDLSDLTLCNFFIITVPTPVDSDKKPDLRPLISASEDVGGVLKQGDVVVYESTVYPGATEEICVPILESSSGLRFDLDFFVGYSPERINPGDKKRGLADIVKVTSGSSPESGDFIDSVYAKVITAGTHRAESIKIAEAAKVIENAQRDINIAFVNELALLFDHLEIDTGKVLEAARTKWNFLDFRPGLVGGHCIGVDPYYLTYRAEMAGYVPDIILAGRKLNDQMGSRMAKKTLKEMRAMGFEVESSAVLVLGFTFKEDCPDTRNTKVIDLVRSLESQVPVVEVWDPIADSEGVEEEYGIRLLSEIKRFDYAAIVIAVEHGVFREIGIENIMGWGCQNCVVFDLKGMFPNSDGTVRI